MRIQASHVVGDGKACYVNSYAQSRAVGFFFFFFFSLVAFHQSGKPNWSAGTAAVCIAMRLAHNWSLRACARPHRCPLAIGEIAVRARTSSLLNLGSIRSRSTYSVSGGRGGRGSTSPEIWVVENRAWERQPRWFRLDVLGEEKESRGEKGNRDS